MSNDERRSRRPSCRQFGTSIPQREMPEAQMTGIQMKLWHHDCPHSYVITIRPTKHRLQMVCVLCGQDVDHKSILRKAAEQAKVMRTIPQGVT